MAGSEARVGPNAIIQIEKAVARDLGAEFARALLSSAGLSHGTAASLKSMVRQEDAQRLFWTVGKELPEADAARIMRDAGLETANYLLANRIPRAAQALLKVLPRSLSARLLLTAIRHHAWTFAGSGIVVCHWKPLALEIVGNPLAMPGCCWHRAIFERMFEELVSSKARVEHNECCARGADSCRFEFVL